MFENINNIDNAFLQSKVLLGTLKSENAVSVISVSFHDKRAYIGYSVECTLSVVDLEKDSCNFCREIMKFEHLTEGRRKSNFKSLQLLGLFEKSKAEGNGCLIREMTGISCCQEENVLLLNFDKKNLLLVDILSQNGLKLVEMSAPQPEDEQVERKWRNCFITKNTRNAIAAEEKQSLMHIWRLSLSPLRANHVTYVNVHSDGHFPIAISESDSPFAATASNLHTAIKIWDVQKFSYSNLDDNENVREIEDSECVVNTVQKLPHIYNNPIDLVAAVPAKDMLYIKKYRAITAGRKSVYTSKDCFGIDVWNIVTLECKYFLPFGNYGDLLSMKATTERLLLLIAISLRKYRFAIMNTENSESTLLLLRDIEDVASEIIVSQNDKYAAVLAASAIPIFNIKTGNYLLKLPHTLIFRFMYHPHEDCLFYCEKGKSLTYVNLINEKASECNDVLIRCNLNRIDDIQCVPKRVSVFLITEYEGITGRTVAVAFKIDKTIKNILKLFEFDGASANGWLCLSPDGRYALDKQLHCFDLDENVNTKLKCTFASFKNSIKQSSSFGWFTENNTVIFVNSETNILYAGHAENGIILGCAAMHERIRSIALFRAGLVAVLGREDGHLIPVRIFPAGYLRLNSNEVSQETVSGKDDWEMITSKPNISFDDPFFSCSSSESSPKMKRKNRFKLFFKERAKSIEHLLGKPSKSEIESKNLSTELNKDVFIAKRTCRLLDISDTSTYTTADFSVLSPTIENSLKLVHKSIHVDLPEGFMTLTSRSTPKRSLFDVETSKCVYKTLPKNFKKKFDHG